MNNIVRATSYKILVGTQKVLRLNLLPFYDTTQTYTINFSTKTIKRD